MWLFGTQEWIPTSQKEQTFWKPKMRSCSPWFAYVFTLTSCSFPHGLLWVSVSPQTFKQILTTTTQCTVSGSSSTDLKALLANTGFLRSRGCVYSVCFSKSFKHFFSAWYNWFSLRKTFCLVKRQGKEIQETTPRGSHGVLWPVL